ncbi:MAG: hypothetical protein GXO17_03210 [Thermodesulfobacteria bacterium]|nr:hypothetical protein [Thermodesulfobacteriota bacterium]
MMLASSVSAAPQVEGTLFARGATDLYHENDYEDRSLDHEYLLLESRFYPSDRVSGRLGFKLDRLAFHGHGRNREELTPLLWETYLRFEGDKLELTLGNQIIRWGKADEISVLDNLSRQDLRELFTLRAPERRRPWPWLRARYFASSFTLEGVFTLFPLTPRRHDFDSDWAVFDHLLRQIELSPFGQFFTLRLSKQKLVPSLRNAEFGFRLETTQGNFDLAFSFLHAHNRSFYRYIKSFPITGFSLKHPSDPIKDLLDQWSSIQIVSDRIETRVPQDNIFGFSFETTYRGAGIRGEVAYHTSRVFLKEDLTSVRKPYLRGVIGFDYNFSHGLYVNFQFLTQRIINYSDKIILDPKLDSYFFLRLSKSFLRDFLTLRVDSVYGITTRSYYLNPEIAYKWRDSTEIFLGLHLIDGPRGTFFDPFDANDQIYLGTRINF